jgi:catechol 2,3-dioxygenase-like lactoylglutathione lyase family enzyme
MTRVSGLRGLILNSTDVERSAEFFDTVWGLQRIEAAPGEGAYFKGTGSEPCILGLVPGEGRGINTVRFALESTTHVDEAYRVLGERGVTILSEPDTLELPGNYHGFHTQDPDGNRIELSAIIDAGTSNDSTPFVPEKMSHFVLNSPNNVAMRDFYVDALGFELADWYAKNILFFLRCTEEHHCMGIEKSDNSSLNHVAFQVADLDAMMRCVGQMQQKGFEPLWGPGRHGPGGNCFCYFVSPDDYVVEYTSELIQIPEGTEWTPQEWKLGPDNANVWGTGGRNERAIKLMSGH